MELAGKTALVTGAARGIGAACAARYRAEGATVFATDIVAGEDGHVLDVRDPRAWQELVASLPDLDIVHLNAGGFRPGFSPVDEPARVPLADISDEAWSQIFRVNVDGVFFGLRTVLPGMMQRRSGDIIITASMAGLIPAPGDIAYPATKHAVIGLMRTVAEDLGGTGVTISALCPATVDTDMVPDQAKALVRDMGMPLSTADNVVEAAMRALRERKNGACWTVWGDTIGEYKAAQIFDLVDFG